LRARGLLNHRCLRPLIALRTRRGISPMAAPNVGASAGAARFEPAQRAAATGVTEQQAHRWSRASTSTRNVSTLRWGCYVAVPGHPVPCAVCACARPWQRPTSPRACLSSLRCTHRYTYFIVSSITSRPNCTPHTRATMAPVHPARHCCLHYTNLHSAEFAASNTEPFLACNCCGVAAVYILCALLHIGVERGTAAATASTHPALNLSTHRPRPGARASTPQA
jgi:hypothetical protein